MYNFFANNTAINGKYRIDGRDFNHIINVLRMKAGDRLLISVNGKSDLCQIDNVFSDYLFATVIEEGYMNCELPINLTLLQGLPKADKLELIIQKAVELGATEIVPVSMARSVVKIEDKKKAQKTERWQAIAESGAKQSKRTIIPTVLQPVSFKQVMGFADRFDCLIVPYENKNGMTDTVEALKQLKKGSSVGVIIGPEGGFDDSEIEALKNLTNVKIVSLGKRILRTETAAITALSMIMLYAETHLN